MNARFDGRGYLADPRDPHATPPQELFVVPREGGDPRQLTTQGVNVQSPSWRPDSRALVFTANTFERDEYVYERADIFTVELEGPVRRVTDDGFDHSAAVWAADGSIVAVREQSLNQIIAASQTFGSPTDLYRFPADGGTPVNLTAAWDYIPGPPRIAPEGRVLQFTAGVAGSTHLFRVPLTGGAVEPVTRGNRRIADASIAWDVAARRLRRRRCHPPRPRSTSRHLDGSGERRLIAVQRRAPAPRSAPRPAEPAAVSSKDGTAVEGWVIMPATADRPHARAAHPRHPRRTARRLRQRLLGAVPALGGARATPCSTPTRAAPPSTARQLLWATWGGWGGRDFEDVMAGVDHVVARYPIDPKRLGVTGYSYGGLSHQLGDHADARASPRRSSALGSPTGSATTAPPTSRAPRRASSTVRRGRRGAPRRCSSGRR